MTILFMDGFDSYSSSVPITTRWSISSGVATNSTAGRFGGKCAGNTNTLIMSHTLPVAKSSLSFGFAHQINNLTTSIPLVTLQDASLTAICTLFLSTSGDLVFVRGSSIGSNVLATASGVITTTVWQHIGLEFTRNATTGIVNIYVNGILVASATGINTGAADIKNIAVRLGSSTTTELLDDYYCVDGATWLGERRITTLRPSADTAQKDFTPNSGTANFSRVNEAAIDGDTSYVSAATVNNEDIYDLDDLSYTPTGVDAVQILLAGRKDDAATRTIAPVLVSGATTDVGSDVAMAATYTLATQIHETDPNTSAAWTVSAVNALKAGMKVTT